MKIDQRTKKSAYIELDNGLVVYVDTSTRENIVHIWQGEDATEEIKLIDGVICQNSFPSNVEGRK
tara:strand:- start:506 stop:700 length:195 start_codon:yes stop_codon:yes gene_type:complete